MPTGYTAKLYDGKQTFEKFAMSCARAFGALVTMREDSSGAIPEKFEPSDYHVKAIKEARKSLAEAETMGDARADKFAKEEYDKAIRADIEAGRVESGRRERYRDMIAEAKKWTPPTADHRGLKDFMVEQLESSIKFDCGYNRDKPKLASAAEYRRRKIGKAMSDIAYHESEHAKEVERTNERTAWVQALRDSLMVSR